VELIRTPKQTGGPRVNEIRNPVSLGFRDDNYGKTTIFRRVTVALALAETNRVPTGPACRMLDWDRAKWLIRYVSITRTSGMRGPSSRITRRNFNAESRVPRVSSRGRPVTSTSRNSSGKRMTTIPSRPGAFGFYENKSTNRSRDALVPGREGGGRKKEGGKKNDTSLERLQSACHHIFLKGPRARANACLKCRFMYTKEIRLAEMLRRTFDLQKNTLFSCLPVARPVYLLELSRRNELLRP